MGKSRLSSIASVWRTKDHANSGRNPPCSRNSYNSIDIRRLRRVALRVIAVQMALEGADFIELSASRGCRSTCGRSRSLNSANLQGWRCYRWRCIHEGCWFCPGLLEVHTFLRVAIRDNRPDLAKNLFAGCLPLRMPSDWLRYLTAAG